MPRPEDQSVGQRIRHYRLIKKLTQTQVADRIGVKFQQLQKYETGANRVSCSRLFDIARALEVDPAYFLKGIDDALPEPEVRSAQEATLLNSFRSSSDQAREAILRIAQETAQPCV
ncbi:helix-turn-helix domain-containing protein [Planktotalea sp.]|uniref:helix-turn-helix domain-containing protein n=1 Tax=Planktotalea sp. TaxID=2029877 RepID=UPI003D6C1A5C